MNTAHRAILAAASVATSLAMTGCIFVDGSSASTSYDGYGVTTEAKLNAVVAANTQTKLGESSEVTLARFPAEHVSLMESRLTDEGVHRSIYRVYAREKHYSTKFERFYVFEDDRLVFLTDSETTIWTRYRVKKNADDQSKD